MSRHQTALSDTTSQSCRGISNVYLKFREEWLVSNEMRSEALFFSTYKECSFFSSNSVRKNKARVEKVRGVKFELRDCRRAFGQKYVGEGFRIDKVSILMGHDSTKTTEQHYCHMK